MFITPQKSPLLLLQRVVPLLLRRRTTCCSSSYYYSCCGTTIATTRTRNQIMLRRASRSSSSSSTRMSSSSSSNHNNDSSDVSPLPPITIALLGPPNAGKSTLFNRLLDKEKNRAYRLSSEYSLRKGRKISGRLQASNTNLKKMNKKNKKKSKINNASSTPAGHAIVSQILGTTRDRRECYGRIGNIQFKLIDTAGVDCYRLDNTMSKDQSMYLNKMMMDQTLEAAKHADLIFLLFDARAGSPLSNDLLETVRWLRKGALTATTNKSNRGATTTNNNKIVLLANKLEGSWDYEDGSPIAELLETDVQRLGLGDAIPISALHGDGMADIASLIIEKQQQKQQIQVQEQAEESTGNLVAKSSTTYNDDANKDVVKDISTTKPLQMAILGRPNVGKSTLVNALLNQDRVLVGPNPGVTRDAIAVEWTYDDQYPVQIIDTAGIRRRSQRHKESFINASAAAIDDQQNEHQQPHNNNNSPVIEDMAINDALRAMKIADVAVLVIDAGARMLQRQELAIADAVLKEGRALVVAANKMDLILDVDDDDGGDYSNDDYYYYGDDDGEDDGSYTREDFESDVREQLEARFPFLRKTPVVAMSSLTGECVDELMPVVLKARERWSRTIPTGLLNRWLDDVLREIPPPPVTTTSGGGGSSSKKRPARIKYILQTKGRPPTFLLFCNTDKLPDHYIRYLTRHFQDTFEMYGMEVRFAIKKSSTENPYNSSNAGKKQQQNRGGSGLGGREARKRRFVQHLKATGGKTEKGKRNRHRRRSG